MSDTTSTLLSIAAVLLSPVIALQVQRWLDEQRSAKARKLQIFKTLMTYRGTPLAPNFVQALNTIDVEFTAESESERAVRVAWKILLDHFLNYSASSNPVEKTQALTASLLLAMGKSLGYEFDEVYLKKGAYYPELHLNMEQDLHSIRRGFVELLEGRRRIPVAIFEQKFLDLVDPTLAKPLPPPKGE
jgi:hypothetical protein